MLGEPRSNVGPWPASLGAPPTRTHRSAPAPPTPAGASRRPRTSSCPGSCFSCSTVVSSSAPRTSSAFQSTRSRVFDTTYFGAASIARARFHPLGHPLRPLARPRWPPRGLHHFVGDAAKKKGIGLCEGSRPVAMQLFVHDPGPVITAAVQRTLMEYRRDRIVVLLLEYRDFTGDSFAELMGIRGSNIRRGREATDFGISVGDLVDRVGLPRCAVGVRHVEDGPTAVQDRLPPTC